MLRSSAVGPRSGADLLSLLLVSPCVYLHPERLTRLAIGFFTKMVGAGPHTLYLDDIERWRFVAPAPDAMALSRSTVEATAHHYGSYVKVPPDERVLQRLFENARPFRAAVLRGTGAANVCPADIAIEAPYSGWLILPSSDSGRDVCSKDRFQARARFARGGKGRIVNGAHRRREKRNYL